MLLTGLLWEMKTVTEFKALGKCKHRFELLLREMSSVMSQSESLPSFLSLWPALWQRVLPLEPTRLKQFHIAWDSGRKLPLKSSGAHLFHVIFLGGGWLLLLLPKKIKTPKPTKSWQRKKYWQGRFWKMTRPEFAGGVWNWWKEETSSFDVVLREDSLPGLDLLERMHLFRPLQCCWS